MSSPCPILTPINLYYSSPKLLTTIQSSWNTQPHTQQQIEAQRTSWGQGCSPFCCQIPLFRSNSTQLRPTPTHSTPYLTMGKYHITVTESQRCDSCCRNGHVTVMSHRVTTCDKSPDRSNMRTMGGQRIVTKVKCISSVENKTGTLLSSPCQLWLGVDLTHHG